MTNNTTDSVNLSLLYVVNLANRMSIEKKKNIYSTRWIMLLALFTALGPLSIDMYLPALPLIADEFAVPTQMVANSVPAYFLGLAIGQLVYGPISDRIGRKKPLYFGMSLFVLASLACAFASDAYMLIFARILQALGGCVGVVIARAAIRDRLDVQGSAQAFSSMMIVMGIAPITAPVFGAWLLHLWPWQSIFITLMLVGLLCLILVHYAFEETLEPSKRLQLNVKQVLMLYTKILKDPSFVFPMLTGCLTGAVLFCYINSASAVFMDEFGLSQQSFAYVFSMNAFGIMLFSTLNKRIAQRVQIQQRLLMGGMVQSSGVLIALIAGLLPQTSLSLAMLGMFFAIAGIGLTGPNAMALAMSRQGERAGTASALMGSMQFLGGLLGGVALNFMPWGALLNMAVLMSCFMCFGLIAILKLRKAFI